MRTLSSWLQVIGLSVDIMGILLIATEWLHAMRLGRAAFLKGLYGAQTASIDGPKPEQAKQQTAEYVKEAVRRHWMFWTGVLLSGLASDARLRERSYPRARAVAMSHSRGITPATGWARSLKG